MDTLLKQVLPITLIAILFVIGQRQFFPKIETVTETETIIDTTLVDSLYSVIETLEDIPEAERDTIIKEVFIPVPQITDSVKTYLTGLSDPTIQINVDSKVSKNSLVSQQIEYILKQRLVREQTLELKYNINTITTTRITQTKQNSFLSVGAIINQQSIIPSASYTSRSNITFLFGYDISNDAITGGILVPLF